MPRGRNDVIVRDTVRHGLQLDRRWRNDSTWGISAWSTASEAAQGGSAEAHKVGCHRLPYGGNTSNNQGKEFRLLLEAR